MRWLVAAVIVAAVAGCNAESPEERYRKALHTLTMEQEVYDRMAASLKETEESGSGEEAVGSMRTAIRDQLDKVERARKKVREAEEVRQGP